MTLRVRGKRTAVREPGALYRVDNEGVYVLLVPLTYQHPLPRQTPDEPVRFADFTGGKSTETWLVLHCAIPTVEELNNPAFALNILHIDTVNAPDLSSYVHRVESGSGYPRWVWADTRAIAPLLLPHRVRVHRCHDMHLVQRILKTVITHRHRIKYKPALNMNMTAQPAGTLPVGTQISGQQSLFEGMHITARPGENPQRLWGPIPDGTDTALTPLAEATCGEFLAQLRAIASGPHPGRLQLLARAESTGALVASEINYYGLPFDTAAHDRKLTELLGPRPPEGEPPSILAALAKKIRHDLFAPELNLDSPQELLKALHRAGVQVESTRSHRLSAWADENPSLARERHKLIDPILRYKKLYRIWTANGWRWSDTWVHNGYFYPQFEVGASATGRWGASGGGALQLPAEIRSAIIAPPGQVFTVADGSQIEPRILAALSRDEALAAAGRATDGEMADMYAAITELSRRAKLPITTREQAKVGLLAIMYGGSSGEIGALIPHIAKLFPHAMEFTERAARIGEAGGQVTTFLGRTCPPPSERWWRTVSDRSTEAAQRRAVSTARATGRMTRNFVVQGTAAEWALCWMGLVRSCLLNGSGAPMDTKIIYFLHDELVLCGPATEAEQTGWVVRESAKRAAQLIFGDIPVEFPVSLSVVNNYALAK